MQRVRVVIVEDNRLFRETLELLFGTCARSSTSSPRSAGGAEAIEVCGLLEPDVAVVDYRMPGIDGARATAKLLELSPETRVICLTASVSPEERELVLRAGAVRCLTKDENGSKARSSMPSSSVGPGRPGAPNVATP